MINKPLGFYTYGMGWYDDTVGSGYYNRFDGFRICQVVNSNGDPGDSYSALSTSRWRVPGAYTISLSEGEPEFQWATPADGGGGDSPWAVMGTTETLGISNDASLDNTNPAWWCGQDFEDDDDLFGVINSLPFNQINGNSYSSDTYSRDQLVQETYKNGFWIWRRDNLPPLTQSCLLSYEFENEECWASEEGEVFDLSGNGNTGTIISAVTEPAWTAWPADASAPYCGVFPMQKANKIQIQNDIETTNSKCTYEWLGKVTDATNYNNYVFQTENSVFFRQNPAGTEWDFSSKIQATSPDCMLPNHSTLAIDYQSQTAYLWCGNSGGWSQAGWSNGINSSIYGEVGADFTIGGLGSSGYHYDGDMNMFRIWDGNLNATQAEILWYHSQYKTHW